MDSRVEPSIGGDLVKLLPRLRLFARTLEFSVAAADDLVQMTCLRALERQAQFQPGSRLIAWVIVIMKNIRKDELKKPIKLVQAEPEEMSEVPDTHSQRSTESKLELNDVHRAMHKLSIECREIIGLAAAEESYDDMSQVLGIEKATVGTRLFRCRKKLRRLLDE